MLRKRRNNTWTSALSSVRGVIFSGIIRNMNNNDIKLLAFDISEKLLRYINDRPIPVGGKIPNEFELSQLFSASRNTIR